jgi:hypothetical protein
MVELWMRQNNMGIDDNNDIEDTCGDEQWGVHYSPLSLEDLLSG